MSLAAALQARKLIRAKKSMPSEGPSQPVKPKSIVEAIMSKRKMAMGGEVDCYEDGGMVEDTEMDIDPMSLDEEGDSDEGMAGAEDSKRKMLASIMGKIRAQL